MGSVVADDRVGASSSVAPCVCKSICVQEVTFVTVCVLSVVVYWNSGSVVTNHPLWDAPACQSVRLGSGAVELHGSLSWFNCVRCCHW
jgi:hypothetical protein